MRWPARRRSMPAGSPRSARPSNRASIPPIRAGSPTACCNSSATWPRPASASAPEKPMSIQPADIRQHLERVLRDEAQLLVELEQLLQREADIVRGDDATAIESIGGARHRCIDQLTRLDHERTAACRMLSFGSGREGIDKLLAWCDPGRSLHLRWE